MSNLLSNQFIERSISINILEPKEISPIEDLLIHLIKTKYNLDSYQVLGTKMKSMS